MKAEQLMTKEPRVCSKRGALEDAAQIMWETDCGMVPVIERTDGVDRLVGVLTDRDICMAAYTTGRSLKELPIGRAMSTDLRTCAPDASIEDAEKTMREAQIRRLPVIDGAGAILGILSLADIAREAQREHGRKRPDVTESEVGATLGAIAQPHAIAAA
jgi:CBS domain-containing protein